MEEIDKHIAKLANDTAVTYMKVNYDLAAESVLDFLVRYETDELIKTMLMELGPSDMCWHLTDEDLHDLVMMTLSKYHNKENAEDKRKYLINKLIESHRDYLIDQINYGIEIALMDQQDAA
jgi:hypothetical protein